MKFNKSILYTLLGFSSLGLSYQASATMCKPVIWKPNIVLNIKSALYMGTRIQLPEGLSLVTKPLNSNNTWDVEGASNQIMIRPMNAEKGAENAMITAFLSDGSTLDIEARRVYKKYNDACVVMTAQKNYAKQAAQALAQIHANQRAGQFNVMTMQQVARLQKENSSLKQKFVKEKKDAVLNALRTYRYHIYTRYNWEQDDGGFEGKGLIADVYDDGRFTYIRINRNNKGLLSVSAEVGGKEAIIPTNYDDNYRIYTMSGIYPKFKLSIDGVQVHITRDDNSTNGES